MAEPTTATIGSVPIHDVHENQGYSQTTHENATTNDFSGFENQSNMQKGSSRSTLEELEDLKAKVAALTARLDEMAGDNKGETRSENNTEKNRPAEDGSEEEDSEENSEEEDSEEDDSEKEDSEEEGSEEEGISEHLCLEIKRLSLDTWSTYKDLKRKEVSENVLVVYQKSVNRQELGTEEVLDADFQDRWSEERIQHIPYRLQINSRPLLQALKVITNTRMPPTPCVMFPPFKAIIGSYDKIQKLLERKETAISQYQQKDESSASIGLAALENPEMEDELKYQKIVADHLKCLLQFIEVDLKEILDLRSQIKNGTLKKISFSNLWHLFTPGVVVFPNTEMLGRSMKEYSYPRAFILWSVAQGHPTLLRKRVKREKNPFDLEIDAEGSVRATNELLEGPCKPLRLGLYGMGYDGQYLMRDTYRYRVEEYRGEKHITSLAFYPARFCPRYSQTYQELVKRGEHYVRALKDCYNEYHGLTMDDDPEEVDGGVVTDSKTGFSMDSKDIKRRKPISAMERMYEEPEDWEEQAITGGSSYDDQQFDRENFVNPDALKPINPGDPTQMKNITENYYLLLRKDILGFVLRIRKWRFLDIDLVQKPEETTEGGKTPFDELVIKESYKNTILALVQSHSAGPDLLKQRIQQGESVSMDLVKGKGRGLVILLHGAPGVGKTSTAETVAAHTKRPLYPITCGDLGMTAGEVEAALDTHFQLAHKWGCVLLLDEADVFLARRQAGDVKRNALVSVFLRTLEYYSGILILTTNRVGEIDEAFHSRIKMSFYYQPLNEKRTIQIWKNSLGKIEEAAKRNKEKATIIKIDDNERNKILKFAKVHFRKNSKDKKKQPWNGRQIRNAFQTALALADYDRLEKLERKIKEGKITLSDIGTEPKHRTVKLKVKHFRQVAKVTADYHKYVTTMQKGKTNETLAAMHQLRANDSELDAPENQRAIQQAEGSSKGKQKTNKPKEIRVRTPVLRSDTDSEEADTDNDSGDDDDDGNDDSESSDESDI